jgi:hypothetical protein
MKRRLYRILVWLTMVTTGGTVFGIVSPIYTGGFDTSGSPGAGCSRFWTNGLMESVDLCYVFDCEQGWLGGAFDPCADDGSSLFLDCPGAVPIIDEEDLEEPAF